MIQQSFKENKPILYLIATPIGNLSEMTPRALEILSEVDVVAAEDTRVSSKLLAHFDIHKPMIAYHDHNEDTMSEHLLSEMDSGKKIALMSDAGYPLISDPGYRVVQAAVEKGYHVISISGSSAFLNALVVSGLPSYPFAFMGFLESKEHALKKQLEEHKDLEMTLIYYVSVHKVEKTLEFMYDIFGNRQIALARELTKKHEEIIRGSISEVLDAMVTIKGEYVLVVEGNQANKEESSLDEVLNEVDDLIGLGVKPSKAISYLSKKRQISKNKLYDVYHERKG